MKSIWATHKSERRITRKKRHTNSFLVAHHVPESIASKEEIVIISSDRLMHAIRSSRNDIAFLEHVIAQSARDSENTIDALITSNKTTGTLNSLLLLCEREECVSENGTAKGTNGLGPLEAMPCDQWSDTVLDAFGCVFEEREREREIVRERGNSFNTQQHEPKHGTAIANVGAVQETLIILSTDDTSHRGGTASKNVLSSQLCVCVKVGLLISCSE